MDFVNRSMATFGKNVRGNRLLLKFLSVLISQGNHRASAPIRRLNFPHVKLPSSMSVPSRVALNLAF